MKYNIIKGTTGIILTLIGKTAYQLQLTKEDIPAVVGILKAKGARNIEIKVANAVLGWGYSGVLTLNVNGHIESFNDTEKLNDLIDELTEIYTNVPEEKKEPTSWCLVDDDNKPVELIWHTRTDEFELWVGGCEMNMHKNVYELLVMFVAHCLDLRKNANGGTERVSFSWTYYGYKYSITDIQNVGLRFVNKTDKVKVIIKDKKALYESIRIGSLQWFVN